MFFKDQVKTDSMNLGLRGYMVNVYNLMALGLVMTGGVAYMVASVPFLMNLLFGNAALSLVVVFSPIVLVFFLSAGINKLSVKSATTLFFAYSALMGCSLSFIFLVYSGDSIARVFFITAAMFLSMSIYGYTTKKDLMQFGSFLFMGVIGIVIASVVNMFMQSSAMHYAISFIAVVLFTGLTAYDSQKIKMMYFNGDSQIVLQRKSIISALSLYLDFLNIFLHLLRLMGDRK